MNHSFQTGEDFALAMDAGDPLAHFRQRFFIPPAKDGADSIYLCGHSLGLQPKNADSCIQEALHDWAQLGVAGHFRAKHPWTAYHRLLTEQTAELVGAQPLEVVVMNTLTVNLHLMMASFYRPTSRRHKILIERGAFPSDQYAVKSQIGFHGFDLQTSLIEAGPREGESCLRDEDVVELIEREGDSIALVLLGGLNYVTGQIFDMAGIAKTAHKKGCVVGFDLAHAAGNIPLSLHEWNPDFAVWCSYKYLNGGPGCVAGCFVHERHGREWKGTRLAGWWGNDEKTRFQMGPEFCATSGAEGWQLSNPPILALAALRASMEIFAEAGIERIRKKSVLLTGYLEFLLHSERLSGFSIVTPPEEGRRGAQLSIRLPDRGRDLCDRLSSEGVIGDWREPDVYRVAPVPLYNSFHDVYRFVKRFGAALQ